MFPNTGVAIKAKLSGHGPSLLDDASFRDQIWARTLEELEKTLGKTDYQTVQEFPGFEQYYKFLREKIVPHGNQSPPIDRLMMGLERIRGFTTLFLLVQAGNNINVSLIGGIIFLLVDLSWRSISRLNEIIDMLDDMGHDLLIFEEYKWVFESNPDLEDTLVHTAADIVKFLTEVTRHFRNHPNDNISTHAAALRLALGTKFDKTRQQIKKQTSRLKERAQARALQRSQLELWEELRQLKLELARNDLSATPVTGTIEPQATIPCHIFPAVRDPNFSGRDDILNVIHEHLDHTSTQTKMTSWGLHGMPAIGKTSLALEYAHSRIESGIPVVLWVNSEKRIDMDQSFNNIAVSLGLEGAELHGNPLKNRLLVSKWLQRTQYNWLVIFDNVENPDDLRSSWLTGPRGSILVTSRSELPYGPTSGGTFVPPFPANEGSECLLKIVRQRAYSDVERQAAIEFSQELGGHALALTLMGTKIRSRSKTIAKALAQYRENPSTGPFKQGDRMVLGNPYYPKKWEMVLNNIFSGIGEDARNQDTLTLLGVLSFLAAEDVSDSFFKPQETSELPPSLSFSADAEETICRFDDALTPLLDASLVHREPETGILSMHRLLQDGFIHWLGPDAAFESFRAAVKMIYLAFPRHQKGRGLRNQWAACNLAVSHVLALSDRYRCHRWKTVCLSDLDIFLELIKSCCWFLMERGSWLEYRELFSIAELICHDKGSLSWANLLNSASLVESERGNTAKARPYIETALQIREKLCPPNDMDLSDVYNNYGFMLITESQSQETMDEAQTYFKAAIKIDETLPEGYQVLHVRYLNLGKVLCVRGDFDEAEKCYEIGKTYSERTFGRSTHFVGRYYYLLGDLRLQQSRYEDAKLLIRQSLNIQEQENETHPLVSATQMKLADILMKMNLVDDAISELKKAQLICEANIKSKGDKGDYARVLRFFGEAYERKGELETAAEYCRQADEIRREVQGARYYELPDTIDSFQLMVWSGYR